MSLVRNKQVKVFYTELADGKVVKPLTEEEAGDVVRIVMGRSDVIFAEVQDYVG